MSDSAKCPRCGVQLPLNFAAGNCPTCLMQQGMSPSTYNGGTGSSSGSSRSGRHRSWTPPTPAELAPRFPQLEIVELLGQGGMGAVYKVRQRDLDRWAALKVLPDDVAHDPNFAERFQREARALALLGHQHIVTVYEFGQRDGVYFLLMEYIDGVTLRQAIRAGQITSRDALGIVTQICDALQFAHEEGVVHRDIKPENILIDKRGRVKIADFGLAKLLGGSVEVPTLTGTHQVMGTPMYMAPEQMEGTRGVDHRADIFSLGVVFYELLTGELPLGRFAPPSQKYQLDVRLDEVVLRTLEKEPDRRYQQASDVKCDVESIRNQPLVAAPVATESPRKPRILTRAAFSLVGIGALLGLCCMLLFVASMSNNLRAARDQARLAAEREMNARMSYEKALWAERQEQRDQASPKGENEDLTETRAVVLFTPDGAKLHPNFGTDIFSTDQREIVNLILGKIHKEYLTLEGRHTEWSTKNDGTPVAVIATYDEELSGLENELWTAIDTQLPIAQQRFLRDRLPLYADASKPVAFANSEFAGGNGLSGMGGAMGMMGASPMQPAGGGFPSTLRYPQLLGWKRNPFPIRITIGRRGKWFRWTIEVASRATTSDPYGVGGKSEQVTPQYQIADSGDAPNLPTGLLRFYRATGSNGVEPLSPEISRRPPPTIFENLKQPSGPDDEQQVTHPFAHQEFNEPPSTPDDETKPEQNLTQLDNQVIAPTSIRDLTQQSSYVRFKDNEPRLNPEFGNDFLTDDDRQKVNSILAKAHREFLELEQRHTNWELKKDGTQFSIISPYQEEFAKLENEFWTAIDRQLPIEAQRFLRESLPLFADGRDPLPTAKMMLSDDLTGVEKIENLREMQLFGFRTDRFPISVSIRRRGTWYCWSLMAPGNGIENGEAPELPSGLRRFWRAESGVEPKTSLTIPTTDSSIPDTSDETNDSVTEPNVTEQPNDNAVRLEHELQALDDLRHGDNTNWDEVERRVNELLANATKQEQKARIHGQAAMFYGQADIRGRAAEVMYHAKEALKYGRDPVQRSGMFMCLGTAALHQDDDPKNWLTRRDEAARWYLKGYSELCLYNLPTTAPSFPAVGKIDNETDGRALEEFDIEHIAAEIRHVEELKARKEAEHIRALVQRRDQYTRSLSGIFGRFQKQHANDPEAKETFLLIASEILRSPGDVKKLMDSVWIENKISEPTN